MTPQATAGEGLSEFDRLVSQRADIEDRQRATAVRLLRVLAAFNAPYTTDKFGEAQALNALWTSGLCEKGWTDDGRNCWTINESGKAASTPPPPGASPCSFEGEL